MLDLGLELPEVLLGSLVLVGLSTDEEIVDQSSPLLSFVNFFAGNPL